MDEALRRKYAVYNTAEAELKAAETHPSTGNLESLPTLTKLCSFPKAKLEANAKKLQDFAQLHDANQYGEDGKFMLPLLIFVKITYAKQARYIPVLVHNLKRRDSTGLLAKPLKTGKPTPPGVIGVNQICVVGYRLRTFIKSGDLSTHLDFRVEEICRLANMSESWHSSEIGPLKWLIPIGDVGSNSNFEVLQFLKAFNKCPPAKWPLQVANWDAAQVPTTKLPLIITKNRTTKEKFAIGNGNCGTGGKSIVCELTATASEQLASAEFEFPTPPPSSVHIPLSPRLIPPPPRTPASPPPSSEVASSTCTSLSNSSEMKNVHMHMFDLESYLRMSQKDLKPTTAAENIQQNEHKVSSPIQIEVGAFGELSAIDTAMSLAFLEDLITNPLSPLSPSLMSF